MLQYNYVYTQPGKFCNGSTSAADYTMDTVTGCIQFCGFKGFRFFDFSDSNTECGCYTRSCGQFITSSAFSYGNITDVIKVGL